MTDNPFFIVFQAIVIVWITGFFFVIAFGVITSVAGFFDIEIVVYRKGKRIV